MRVEKAAAGIRASQRVTVNPEASQPKRLDLPVVLEQVSPSGGISLRLSFGHPENERHSVFIESLDMMTYPPTGQQTNGRAGNGGRRTSNGNSDGRIDWGIGHRSRESRINYMLANGVHRLCSVSPMWSWNDGYE